MPMQCLTGPEIARSMRRHRVTICALAARMRITLKRVRQVRAGGVQGEAFCRDWIEAITGVDPKAGSIETRHL